ncbi:hypothetical protein QTV49_001750 [Vibrio vulnificus]|nr:hypothetical protein [Vibrio vulnificus]
MSNCRKFIVAKEVVEDFCTRLSNFSDTKGCSLTAEQAGGLLMSVCKDSADSASSAFLVKFHHARQYTDEEVMSESVESFYNSQIDSRNKLIFPKELCFAGSIEFKISDEMLGYYLSLAKEIHSSFEVREDAESLIVRILSSSSWFIYEYLTNCHKDSYVRDGFYETVLSTLLPDTDLEVLSKKIIRQRIWVKYWLSLGQIEVPRSYIDVLYNAAHSHEISNGCFFGLSDDEFLWWCQNDPKLMNVAFASFCHQDSLMYSSRNVREMVAEYVSQRPEHLVPNGEKTTSLTRRVGVDDTEKFQELFNMLGLECQNKKVEFLIQHAPLLFEFDASAEVKSGYLGRVLSAMT